MKVMFSVVCLFSAFIIRSYIIYLYGTMCGVNIFDWSTWHQVFHADSLTCQTLEWGIEHSNDFLISLGISVGLYVLQSIKKEMRLR